jgi:hypothetical protein
MRRDQILWVVEDQSEDILIFAGRHGFREMTVPFLSKLYTHLGCKSKGARPSTEVPLARALVKHVLPGLTNEQVEAHVKLRKKPKDEKEPESTVLMDAMNMGMTCNLFDDDVVQNIDKYHKSRGLCFAEAGAGEGSGGSGSKASAPGSSSSSSGREKISVTGYHAPEPAKAYLPKVSGCASAVMELGSCAGRLCTPPRPHPRIGDGLGARNSQSPKPCSMF